MGLCLKILLFYSFNVVTSNNTILSKFDLNAWWGPTSNIDKVNTSVRPFKITFEDEMINDLMYRVKNYRYSADPLDNTFRYGFNIKQLKKWLLYLVEEYSFVKRAEYMNQHNHFLINIQGLDIHFVKVPAVSTNKTVLPLLMMHGWASSFLEFYDIIPYLIADSEDRNFVLELIIPSVPGFAYSDAAVRVGLGSNEMAILMRNFMHELGYKKFLFYGGDFGAYIGGAIATLFPEEVLGYHTTLGMAFTTNAIKLAAVGQLFPDLVVEESTADRIYPLTNTLSKLMTESGYFHMQATKPDTIGIALSDSPVGFLAYLLQIISMVTRKNNDQKEDGGLLEHYTEDQLIDTVMIYWATNKITTSCRIYAETFNKASWRMMLQEYPTDVPTCIIQAPDEVFYLFPKMLETKFTNILRVTVLGEGGHFLAVEQPKIFADDLLSAVQLFLDYHNNVQDVY